MDFRPFEKTMRPIFDNMELIERDNFLSALDSGFREAAAGEGYSFFIIGEAGIGKTSLVKAFLKKIERESIQYIGACDSLFTPRPLGPLYDLAVQMNKTWINEIHSVSSRAELFSRFVQELTQKQKPVVIVFEDIHWADEATLDFVKFLARRISRLKCLFILTLRDDEINQQYSLRNVFSDLAPDTFTRLVLTPLSKQAVQKLADEVGELQMLCGRQQVYLVGGGNSAGQAALYFASHARSVTILCRSAGPERTMSQYLLDQLAARSNIEVLTHSEVVRVEGEGKLEAIVVKNSQTGEEATLESGGLFILIGADAETGWLPPEIARDRRGYVLTGSELAGTDRWELDRDPYLLETSVPGIFACGDVRLGPVKRVAAAVGEGSMAIAFVHQYLREAEERAGAVAG